MEVRDARDSDLPIIAEMIADFVKGHIAENHARSPENLREAYFGDQPAGAAERAFSAAAR